jgi:flagellin
VATEITSLRAEIDRIAGATTFNGQNLLTGALSVSQSGGSIAAGKLLNTGHTATLTTIDLSGAKASTTYTLTANGGSLTLSDGTTNGNAQTVALASTIGASGVETINFTNMGVKLTVTGDTAKTDAELAGDLASTLVTAGTLGTNLVVGQTLSQTSNGSVTRNGGSSSANGLAAAPAPSAVASAGVGQGTLTLAYAAGSISGTLDGEVFTATVLATGAGNSHTVQLTDAARGNTIDLTYKEGAGSPTQDLVGADLAGSTFVFGAGAGTATVSSTYVNSGAPAVTPGTKTFTAVDATHISMNGASLAVTDLTAGTSKTYNFNGINITLAADATTGISAKAIISNLLQTTSNTVVVSGATTGTTVTGGTAAANFQVGANAADSMAVTFANARLNSTSTSAAGYGNLDAAITAFATATTTNQGAGIVAAAQALITSVDTAIGYVSKTRGDLGAVQNRLEHTTAAISVASENLNASESRIRDLDVASEMVNFTKTQILQQAGTAILAQANSAPQNILTLLR